MPSAVSGGPEGVRKRSRYPHRHRDIGDQQQIGRAETHRVREHGVQRGEIFSNIGPGVARAWNGAVQLRDNLGQLVFISWHQRMI